MRVSEMKYVLRVKSGIRQRESVCVHACGHSFFLFVSSFFFVTLKVKVKGFVNAFIVVP